ncbi:MAG TPA: trigger factor [Candidatus Paceibacterota bacterium]|nr:trigger factor [Candidatus Paceibacterota bacterium]
MTYRIENVSIDRKKDGTATITAAIPADAMDAYRAKAIAKLGADVKLPGFRPGHVPANVLESQIGEGAIMQEAAELAMAEQYPQLLSEEKLSFLGRPDISITKLAKGNEMTFTVTASLLPEFTLPAYQAIAKEHREKMEKPAVTDEEVTDTLTHLSRERAKIERIEAGDEAEAAGKAAAELPLEELPPIDDAFVQTLGYADAATFTTKLRENIANEKANREREKARIAMMEDIIGKTELTIPPPVIEAELENMEAQFAHDLSHNGMTLEQYLAEAKKTKEALHDEWRDGARKRAAMQLIVRKIAQEERVAPDPHQVEQEVAHIVSHTKDVDPAAVRAYVVNGLTTELVFRLLEGQEPQAEASADEAGSEEA